MLQTDPIDDISPYVDEEIAEVFRAFPRPSSTVAGSQEALLRLAREPIEHYVTGIVARPVPEGMRREDRTIPGTGDQPAVKVRVYAPKQRSTDLLPGLVWLHGGGYIAGSYLMSEPLLLSFVEQIGCVAVSVEYRLAPEHPFPAGLEDCYTALSWLAMSAEEWGVDPARIAIGGESAGGGLAAALALLARDRDEVKVAFQLLIYPMLDDRFLTSSSQQINDPRVPTQESIRLSWQWYVQAERGSESISPYAAPSRAADLSHLPPAYIGVGTMDLFRDENIAYAQRLAKALVPVELHVFPGGYHGSELMAPFAQISQQFVQDQRRVLKRALFPKARTQPEEGAPLTLDIPLKKRFAQAETRAILERHLSAAVLNHPQLEMAMGFSLRQLAAFDASLLSSETLAALEADFARRG